METFYADALRLIIVHLSPIDAVHFASTCKYLHKHLRRDPYITMWEDRWRGQWRPGESIHTCLRTYIHINEVCAQEANITAVKTGDLRLVKIFSVMIPRWSLYVAARLQHTEVLKYLQSKLKCLPCNIDTITQHAAAVREGKLNESPSHAWILLQAAEHGDLEAIQCHNWINKHTYRYLCRALVCAAANGHLHILQWTAEDNSGAVSHACAKSCHLHVLQWWATQPHAHWYGYLAYHTAVQNNATNALDFLLQVMPGRLSHSQKFELCKVAVTYNCPDAFEWLCSHKMVVRGSRIIRGILRRRTKFPNYTPELNAMIAQCHNRLRDVCNDSPRQ